MIRPPRDFVQTFLTDSIAAAALRRDLNNARRAVETSFCEMRATELNFRTCLETARRLSDALGVQTDRRERVSNGWRMHHQERRGVGHAKWRRLAAGEEI